MREKESKDEPGSFMKAETNVMFTQMSAKTDINPFGEKSVADIVK